MAARKGDQHLVRRSRVDLAAYHELINRAGSLDLCEGVAVLVIHGKHLAVEHDLHVRIAAGASGPQLVGAAQL